MDVLQTVERSLGLQIATPQSWALSVSGGLDSTVLLHVMADLRAIFGFELVVHHFNFHLRGDESDADQAFVEDQCRDREVPCIVHHRVIDASSAVLESTRAFRREVMNSLARTWRWVEAHHLDDQVETFLFRLFRGAGLDGLSGMQKVENQTSGHTIFRPLLSIQKEDLREFANDAQISYREDSKNAAIEPSRNYLRHEVIPKIRERFAHFDRSIERTRLICRDALLALYASDDNEEQSLAEAKVQDWQSLREMNRFMRARRLKTWLQQSAGLVLHFDHLDALHEHIEGDAPFVFNLPKDFLLRARKQNAARPKAVIELVTPSKGHQRLQALSR